MSQRHTFDAQDAKETGIKMFEYLGLSLAVFVSTAVPQINLSPQDAAKYGMALTVIGTIAAAIVKFFQHKPVTLDPVSPTVLPTPPISAAPVMPTAPAPVSTPPSSISPTP